jgi:hypothetical protein
MVNNSNEVIVLCQMDSGCQKTWDMLTATAIANVRHCDACQEDVTLCFGIEHVTQFANAGKHAALTAATFQMLVTSTYRRHHLDRSDKFRSFTDTL